jgi:hypothetical protein
MITKQFNNHSLLSCFSWYPLPINIKLILNRLYRQRSTNNDHENTI